MNDQNKNHAEIAPDEGSPTAAETVYALKHCWTNSDKITVQAETVARWVVDYVNGRAVEIVHTFRPGDVVRFDDRRQEGMMATTEDGFEMFVLWCFIEEMATARAGMEI